MKKHIQIRWSYDVWSPARMRKYIIAHGGNGKHIFLLVIEWWLHNIGYYLTAPFVTNETINSLNERFMHVDLVVEVDE